MERKDPLKRFNERVAVQKVLGDRAGVETSPVRKSMETSPAKSSKPKSAARKAPVSTVQKSVEVVEQRREFTYTYPAKVGA